MRQKRSMYVYKCIYDDGGAPCIDSGLLTLGICKPAIRRTARVGDLLFGFGGNREDPPNRLVYIAEVSEVVTGGEYYRDPEFRGRTDCIYRWDGEGVLVLRRNAKRHQYADARPKDLGCSPAYKNATTLICADFRYFGGTGTDEWKRWAPSLAKMVGAMTQGHRVNHSDAVRRELRSLKQRVWRSYAERVLGEPSMKSEHCKSGACRPAKRPRVATLKKKAC